MALVDVNLGVAIVLDKRSLALMNEAISLKPADWWIRLCVEETYPHVVELICYLQGPDGEEKRIFFRESE